MSAGNVTDQEFFRLVSEDPSLASAISSHEWALPHVYCPINGGNAGLKVWKHSWRVWRSWPGTERVEIHFESRRRGCLQVDVEVFPYEGSIDKNPTRIEALKAQLAFKSKLLAAIRSVIMNRPDFRETLGATTSRLRDPGKVSTLCAVQFDSGTGDHTPVSAAADYYRIVIESVAPLIDETLLSVA